LPKLDSSSHYGTANSDTLQYQSNGTGNNAGNLDLNAGSTTGQGNQYRDHGTSISMSSSAHSKMKPYHNGSLDKTSNSGQDNTGNTGTREEYNGDVISQVNSYSGNSASNTGSSISGTGIGSYDNEPLPKLDSSSRANSGGSKRSDNDE